jgi:hypothetical protein
LPGHWSVTIYPFKQGIDYGPRDGTLGLSFHMTEGGDGTLGFLQRHAGESMGEWVNRVNGVSCNALLLTDGTIVQMLDWGHASGNLNPGDRAGEYGYYGHHHLVDVLGTHWTDPNTWTISMEICGYRSTATAPSTWHLPPGPTPAQTAAAIAWGKEMTGRFPTLRGATGHHDQSPKGCPGTTDNMKAIFDGIGGHGLWPEEVPDVPGLTITDLVSAPGTVTVKNIAGVQAVQVDDPSQRFTMPPGSVKTTVAKGKLVGDPLGADTPGNDRHTVRLIGDELAVFLDGQVDYVATDPGCADKVAAEHERTRAADIAALEALP